MIDHKIVTLIKFGITSKIIEKKIADARLTAAQATQLRNIAGVVKKLTIYESLTSPVLSAEVEIQDNKDIASLFPIIGAETIEISFGVPNPGTNELRIFGTEDNPIQLRVVGIKDRHMDNSIARESYTLQLVSSELLASFDKRIAKTYQDKRVEEILKDILTNNLNVLPKRLEFIQQTDKPTTITIPYMTPLDAINLLTLQGVNQQDESSFFFYETLRGFRFESLNNIIKEGKIKAQTLLPRVRMKYKGLVESRDTNNIIGADEITLISAFDYMYMVNKGYFASTTLAVDVLQGQYKKLESTSSDDDFKSKPRLNDLALYSQTNWGSSASYSNKIFLVPTRMISAANTSFTSKDPTIRDNYFAKTLDGRNREILEMQTTVLRIKVPGTPDIGVGKVIYVDYPTPINNNKVVPTEKNLYSGRYLVVAAKHVITNMGVGKYIYETILEACSDSVS